MKEVRIPTKSPFFQRKQTNNHPSRYILVRKKNFVFTPQQRFGVEMCMFFDEKGRGGGDSSPPPKKKRKSKVENVGTGGERC